jgi:hypothetical protein
VGGRGLDKPRSEIHGEVEELNPGRKSQEEIGGGRREAWNDRLN